MASALALRLLFVPPSASSRPSSHLSSTLTPRHRKSPLLTHKPFLSFRRSSSHFLTPSFFIQRPYQINKTYIHIQANPKASIRIASPYSPIYFQLTIQLLVHLPNLSQPLLRAVLLYINTSQLKEIQKEREGYTKAYQQSSPLSPYSFFSPSPSVVNQPAIATPISHLETGTPNNTANSIAIVLVSGTSPSKVLPSQLLQH
ncbi:hypothetical protein EV426DRAFT_280746 [Tirmania nivea]|nr:hypothetical protein EV426DRAFT_280746 [Tirmania nivea]